MKAVGYIRVSTEDQTHGYSLEAQRDRLQAFADAHNMVLTQIYADEGISASKALQKRKAMLQMLSDAEAGMFDVILFKDISRFSRNPSQFYAMVDRLDKCHVSWIAVEQPNLETLTAQGKLLVGIFISVASHESAQIGDRIRFVNETRVKQGGLLGGNQSLPLGYMVGEIDGKKRVVVNEAERDAVVSAFDTFLTTQNIGAVQRSLRDHGIFRTEQAVRAMLKCEMFTGRFHGVDDYCEPIISRDVWEQVQVLRQKRNYTPSTKDVYLFSSLIRCPNCGRTMIGTTNKRWKYYRCKRHKDHMCENANSVSELKLESYLLDHILDDLATKEVTVTPKIKKANLASLKAKFDRLNELYIEGRITRQVYDLKRAEIESQMTPQNAFKHAKTLLSDGWKEYYLQAPKQAKKNAWRSVIDYIVPQADGTFDVHFL